MLDSLPFWVPVVAVFFGGLVFSALAQIAAQRLGFSVLAVVVRTAVRAGVYDPPEPGARPTDSDRGIVAFTQLLTSVHRRMPGSGRSDLLGMVVPVLLTAVVSMLALVSVFGVVPVLLGSRTLVVVGAPWGLAAAVAAICGYVLVVVLTIQTAQRRLA